MRQPSLSGVTQRSNTARGVALGLVAAISVAVVYGILSEPFGVSFGLPVVGFVGGWLIGNAIAYGTWLGEPHESIRSLRWTAVGMTIIAWVGALVIAYVISQALIPQASTALASRLSLNGFVDYFTGLDVTRFFHLIAVAVAAVMARRGAR
jgi:hypothetical protein